MNNRRIVVSEKDYVVLRRLADALPQALVVRNEHYRRFIQEIRNALVTDSPELTAGIVTLRSRVTYTYEHDGATGHAVVVFPAEVKEAPENVSIFSPFGMALIGERAGTVVLYVAPGGQYEVRIDKVEQPVASSATGQTT